jgi:hypothetical protein
VRLFPLLFCSAFPLLAAGCGQCGTTTQTAVDVPVTLAAVRALHHPPDVVVEVTRQVRSKGGGACGHSAICLLLIPIIIYDELFPEKWDQATITDHGLILYEGRFTTGGAFLEATSRKDGFARSIAVLPLDRLKRRVIVEAARAPLLPDGTDGVFVKTPILPQIDLPAEYTRALADAKDASDRAALLVEASTWLGEEALPLLRKTLPGESDKGASLTVAGLCKSPGEEQGKLVRAEVLALLAAKPGLETSTEGLRCAVLSHDTRAARPFAQALGGLICEAPEASTAKSAARAFGAVVGTSEEAKAEVGAELQAAKVEAATKLPLCTRIERTVLLKLLAEQPVTGADMQSALSDEELGDAIASYLDPAKPEIRAAIFAALPGRKSDSSLLGLLEGGEWIPSAEELKTLAAIYPRTGTSSDGARRDRSVFLLFARAKGEPARVDGARKVLEAAVAAAAERDRPRLRAALVLLGDKAQALPASRGLTGMTHMPGRGAQVSIVEALRLAGCTDEEILAAARRAGAVKDEDRGAFCAQ